MQPRLSAPAIDFNVIRRELGIEEDYGADALAQAKNATDRYADEREDRTELALVTIDPPGSMDLDQAVHVSADVDGFVVSYAIADVAALVEPEGPLDQESRRRGTTIYFPDRSVPLHPRELSEGAGSLLPEQIRPAVLWTIRVAPDGAVGDVDVRRALVRSVARLDYAGVTADAAAGRPHPSIADLQRFGEVRQRVALADGAIELDLPDQEVVRGTDGGWTVRIAPRTPADMWNAQLSLLTGRCAGEIMSAAGVGLLRTLPPAEPDALHKLRATADALRVPWPADATPGEFLAGLPEDQPSTLAVMMQAASLMRGAGYLALGAESEPDAPADAASAIHAGIGGLYAHVTAPLRRLGDRFATEVCLSVTQGKPVPDWVVRALPTLPKLLRSADGVAATAERESIDLAEAVVLSGRLGDRFDAVVLQGSEPKRPARIFVDDPAIVASCEGDPPEGSRLPVVLTTADPATRTVEFAPEGT
ncbi:RNB domain-containing ribonuclease [Gordonia sinesedis]